MKDAHRRKVAALAALVIVSSAATVTATGAPRDHATVCHRTGSSVNPFVTIHPNVNGAYHGHLRHSGDVIPPFEYRGDTYSLNWPSDDVRLEHGECVARQPEPEEPSREEPPVVEPGDPIVDEPPFTG